MLYYQKHITAPRIRRCRRTLIVLALLFVFLLLNAGIHSFIDSMLVSQARILFSDALNNAVECTVQDIDTADSFVLLTRDADGNISSVQTDTQSVNEFRARLGAALADNLSQYESIGTDIPLGTLTGLDILTGRGPCIKLKLIQQGSILTDLVSSFSSAGINQTYHTIDCIVSAEFYAVIPGFSAPVPLDAEVMIAQSVIVGEVPDSYTSVNGDQSDTIGRIFDYGDPYGEDIQEQEN